jgi:RNA-directed DNA polymerase
MTKGGSGNAKGGCCNAERRAPNGSTPGQQAPAVGSWPRVSQMQAKLHRWAAADPGRRFDDLFNVAHDPATLIVAFDQVAGNAGSRTPGVDGLTVRRLRSCWTVTSAGSRRRRQADVCQEAQQLYHRPGRW